MPLSRSTFSDIGGATSDIFASAGHKTKAKGARLEAEQYALAAVQARQNAIYEEQATQVKKYQADRAGQSTMGGQKAAVAASGLASAGTALDLLRDSAAQSALHVAVLETQGHIQVEAYQQQAKSFDIMQQASDMAASAEERAAEGALLSAGIKIGAAAIGFFAAGPAGAAAASTAASAVTAASDDVSY